MLRRRVSSFARSVINARLTVSAVTAPMWVALSAGGGHGAWIHKALNDLAFAGDE